MMTLRNEQYQKIYEKFGNPRFLPPEISANVTAAYPDIAQTILGPYYIEDCMKYPETIPTAGKASIVSICDYIPIPLLLEALYPIKEECPLQYKAWELEKMRGSRSKLELENQPQFSLKSPFANIGEFVQG